MNSTVEISVIMSAYNASKYLKEAIDSILTQTFTNFEFIIINDGSVDSTENIIHAYIDNRIVYIRNETNLGLIQSLNKGLERARGKYIARMDADDIAIAERLQEQHRVFLADETVLVTGTDYYVLRDGKLTLETAVNDSDYQKTVLLFATCFAHPTVMMKNIFKETGIRYNPDFYHTEDYRLWTEFSLYGKFYHINKPLLKYRSHPAQISSENRKLQFSLSRKIREDYLKKSGFVFSEEELNTHCFIGNNEVIHTKEQLLQIETWLMSLLAQNEQSGHFSATSFNRAIHKFWLDSCGNTRLGLYAFGAFNRSALTNVYKTDLGLKFKLLVKCIVRRFSPKEV